MHYRNTFRPVAVNLMLLLARKRPCQSTDSVDLSCAYNLMSLLVCECTAGLIGSTHCKEWMMYCPGVDLENSSAFTASMILKGRTNCMCLSNLKGVFR